MGDLQTRGERGARGRRGVQGGEQGLLHSYFIKDLLQGQPCPSTTRDSLISQALQKEREREVLGGGEGGGEEEAWVGQAGRHRE